MCNHPNREQAMTVISDTIWCDPCLTPLVSALNEGGVRTVASCCGHGKRPGNIALKDGRQLFIADAEDAAAIHAFLHGRTERAAPEETNNDH